MNRAWTITLTAALAWIGIALIAAGLTMFTSGLVLLAMRIGGVLS